MIAKTALVALFSCISFANANGISLSIKVSTNWGCSSTQRSSTPSTVKNQCNEAGSFLCGYGLSSVCSSSQTRKPPTDITCPLIGWDQHSVEKCCVPQTEVSQCDCGEGYSFNKVSLKCTPNTGKCSSSQWWHDRSSSCCDNDWSPHEGTCPQGKTCPTDWFWHELDECCRPKHKRSPEPDCDDWDNKYQCCGGGGGPQPSGKPPGYGGGFGGWRKRDVDLRRSGQVQFAQTDMDKMYCPGKLHACSIKSGDSSEWAYECIDPATELESCGGCASNGEGVDCTTIPHAMSVGCESGVCAIYSCQSGFTNNGTTCV